MVNSAVEIDRVADLIAAELLSQLGGDGTPACPSDECAASCSGAHCPAHCPDKVRRLLANGAERFSAGPGVGACDNVLARMIDHTLLAPTASRHDVEGLIEEAVANCFASVCLNPWWVRLAAERLAESPVRVCTVVGFPLGANRTETKVYEATRAVDDGATELDMVINIGALKSGEYSEVERDVNGVVRAADRRASVKVIIEAAHLTDEEKVKACVLAQSAGAHFVKTSTGFGPGGATEEDVRLMRHVVGGELGVKAAGGVGDQPTAMRMIEAGATRIGASAGVRILGGNGGPERPNGDFEENLADREVTTTVQAAPRAKFHRLL
jgi:deoxyribose-phosphate aldolase